MFRAIAISLIASAVYTIAAVTTALAEEARDAEVRKAATRYVDAFNMHDADEVAKLWAEDAVYNDRETGESVVGREAIKQDLAEVFRARPQIRLQFEPATVRFITPDVAQATASATVIVPEEEPTQVSVTAIYVKSGDNWLLDSVTEADLPQPTTAAAALKDLEWLIGDWRDESLEHVSTSTVRWSAGNAFLVRSFLSEVEGELSGGTQVIGWDPRGKVVRSWTFNSDGSFGEAVWSHNDKDWLAKSAQTLSDGGAATGTFVLTPDGPDSMTIKLIGHEINGEPQAASEPVRVVRTQPEDENDVDGPVREKETP